MAVAVAVSLQVFYRRLYARNPRMGSIHEVAREDVSNTALTNHPVPDWVMTG